MKYDALRLELDRIVRQRNTLLRQAAGRLDEAATVTLDVWDAKLAEVGDRFGHARATLVERIRPFVAEAYDHLAGRPTEVGLVYEPAWRAEGLRRALAAARDADVKRGVSTVGPHRDEVALSIGGLPARTHASQGEQRTLALSLRLGAHRLVADRTGSTPVLVLDDVLSELDPGRATALLGHLPHGQVVITTASAVPAAARPDRVHARRRRPRRRRRPAGGIRRAGGHPVNDDDPVPVTAALDGLLRSMRGGAGRAEVGGVFGRWDDAVGPMIAANVRPVRFEQGALLVEVDDPAWATQVRFLTDDIRRRLREESGVEVASVDVRVRRPGSPAADAGTVSRRRRHVRAGIPRGCDTPLVD